MRKDQANTMPPVASAFGKTANGYPTDVPDMESEGGDVPNTSISWDIEAFDRMEGSIKGKNKTFSSNNNINVKQNTGKPITTQLK